MHASVAPTSYPHTCEVSRGLRDTVWGWCENSWVKWDCAGLRSLFVLRPLHEVCSLSLPFITFTLSLWPYWHCSAHIIHQGPMLLCSFDCLPLLFQFFSIPYCNTSVSKKETRQVWSVHRGLACLCSFCACPLHECCAPSPLIVTVIASLPFITNPQSRQGKCRGNAFVCAPSIPPLLTIFYLAFTSSLMTIPTILHFFPQHPQTTILANAHPHTQ